MAESSAPTLPKSDSDTFLTTPDEDDDDKIINADTGLEGDGLKHRAPKKDLLEIDRFTICGNRIDWTPQEQPVSAVSWLHSKVQGSDTGHGWCSDWTYSCAPDPWSIYLFISYKTSQGIKLLLQASVAASDVSSWSSPFPLNQVAWGWAKTGILRWSRPRTDKQNCICDIVCDHRNITAGLQVCLQKHNHMYSEDLFLKRTKANFFNFLISKVWNILIYKMKFLTEISD